jgi:hypothetical protein
LKFPTGAPLLLPPELDPLDELEPELEPMLELALELECEVEPEVDPVLALVLELALLLEREPVLPELVDPVEVLLPLLVLPPELPVAPGAWHSWSAPQTCPAGHCPSGQLKT